MRNKFSIKKGIIKVLILFFQVGCTLSSREVFDLAYQEQRLVNTLRMGPYLSIADDGVFNQLNHKVLDFDIDNMEVEVYDVTPEGIVGRSEYSLEIIEDNSAFEGILRFYGSGPYNNKFIGVSGLINLDGAFLKFNIQDSRDNAVANARNKPSWEYVSEPIIFRLTTVYKGDKIVSLDTEEFLNREEYNYFTPKITEGGIGVKDTHTLEDRGKVEGGTDTGIVDEVKLISTVVFPPNKEIYEVEIDGETEYWGIEFSSEDTKMRIVEEDTFDKTKFELDKLDESFNYDLEENAKINNKSIRLLKDHQMVLLEKPTVGGKPRDGEYYWDKTDELIFDPDTMKLKVITTFNIYDPTQPFGATNTFNYDIVMKVAAGENAGIFKIEGDDGYGRFDGKWGALNVTKDLDGKVFADLELRDDKRAAEGALEAIILKPTYKYQDRETVTLPYRLAINLQDIGETWVQLQDSGTGSMYYDNENTEKYRFLKPIAPIADRALQYTLVTPGNISTSFYRVEVVRDYNDTNGVFLLHGYTDAELTTEAPNAPMNMRYLAIDRGAELYKTQAKYGIGRTIEEAIEKRDNTPLFNLHESRALPSDYKVITHMEGYGKWVSMTYTGANPGIVPPNPTSGTIPKYKQDNTERWTLDTSNGPELEMMQIKGGVVLGPVTYTLDNVDDVNEFHGVFKLTRTSGMITGMNDYDDHFAAIRVGEGGQGNRAFIAIDLDQTKAEEELDRIYTGEFYTHQSLDSVPLDADVIETIDGLRYIESEIGTDGKPDGNFIPYNTRYFTFSFNPLVMEIVTVTPGGGIVSTDSYSIEMKENGRDYMGVFQADGVGLLFNNKFFRIDVQDGTGTETEKIRILIGNTLADFAGVVVPVPSANFPEKETTHLRADKLTVPTTAITTMTGLSPTWATVDSIDKMYDDKNNTRLTFDALNKKITIVETNKGAIVGLEVQYTYIMMENNYDVGTGSYDAVIQLSGSGTYRSKYLALEKADPTEPPHNGVEATKGTRFAFESTYDAAKAELLVGPPDPHIIPTTPLADPLSDISIAWQSYGHNTATPPGFGTPSFVQIINGSYDSRNTETWTFDTAKTTVAIQHLNGLNATYNVHMLVATGNSGTAPTITRSEALFYLKSEKVADPYHNRYVYITTHQMINTAGDPDAQSTFNAVISEDRDEVTAGTLAIINMRDYVSASIPSAALDRAALGKKWFRLDPNKYQLDKDDHEVWEFKFNNTAQIKVTDEAGNEEFYNFVSRANISSHRGSFILKGVAAGSTYDNHMVVIGIGGEPIVGGVPSYGGEPFDEHSMRLATVDIGAYPTLEEAEEDAIDKMEKLLEWNFRQEEEAKKPFNPIMKADDIDDRDKGWAKLTKNPAGDWEYDYLSTERWLFTAIAMENISGSTVYDMAINSGTTEPDLSTQTHGIKLIESSKTGQEAVFQIFRNDIGKTNTFVKISLGTGLDTKLMRVGTGSTLETAKAEWNGIAGYNWATFDRATADQTLLTRAQDTGTWALQRTHPINDLTSTGSANTDAPGNGHLKVGDDGAKKPTYDPAETIDITFDAVNSYMAVKVIQDGNENVGLSVRYALIPVENKDEVLGSGIFLGGIYIASGIGQYQDKFVYLEIADVLDPGDVNKGKRARFSIHNSLVDVVARNKTLKDEDTWNFFEAEWIKADSTVFNNVADRQVLGEADITLSRGAFVEIGFDEGVDPPNVYDTELTRTYTIIPEIATVNGIDYVSKTIIISNVSSTSTRDDIYTYEMIQSETGKGEERAIALLIGTGPDGGKYIGMRLPADESKLAVHIADTVVNIETTMEWSTDTIGTPARNLLFRYRRLSSVKSESGILPILEGMGGMVTLDSDLIYVDNNTTEWSFDADNLQATVVERVLGVANTTIYKTVLVKSEKENVNKGILFLKGSGTFNKHYVGVNINTSGSTPQIKFYEFDGATALANAEDIIEDGNADKVNFVKKETVHFPDVEPIIKALISKNGGWSSLNADNEKDTPEKTTNIKFLIGREVILTTGTSPSVEGRFQPVWDEGDPTKTIISIKQKGSIALPIHFDNLVIALDIGSLTDSDGMRFAGQRNIDVQDQLKRDAIILARDVTLTDPNYIPKVLFDLDSDALDEQYAVSGLRWRQMSGDGTMLGGPAGNIGIGEWRKLYTADPETAPWTYKVASDSKSIGISRGSATTPSVEAGNKDYDYLVKMIVEGVDTGIFRLYKGSDLLNTTDDGIYKAEISNNYHMIKVGTGLDHFRMRIVRADSVSKVQSKMDRTPFNNMIAEEVWINLTSSAVSNMNYDTFVTPATQRENSAIRWVEKPLAETFSELNHNYWTFDHDNGGLLIAYYNVVLNGVTSTLSYEMTLMQRLSDISGVYVLTGVGIFTGRIMAFERSDLTGTDKNKADFFITEADNTYMAAIDGLKDRKADPDEPKWIDKKTLVETIVSIENVKLLNDIVSVDPTAWALATSVLVLDKRNNETWEFELPPTVAGVQDPKVQISTTVNGATSTESYNIIMIQDATDKAVFSLENPAPGLTLHRWVVAMEINATDPIKNIVVELFDGSTDYDKAVQDGKDALIAGLTVDETTLRYEKSEILPENDYEVITKLAEIGNTVTLDYDEIYLDHDTRELDFDVNAGTVLITTRTSGDGGATFTSVNHTYFLNPVKGITSDGGGGSIERGMYYLKATKGAPTGADPLNLHNNFIMLEANSRFDNADDLYKLTGYGKFDYQTDEVFIDDNFDDDRVNLAVESAVDLPDADRGLLALYNMAQGNAPAGAVGDGLGFLMEDENDFNYNPAKTEELYIDVHQRLVIYAVIKADSAKDKQYHTNYYRIQLRDSTISDNRFTEQVIFKLIGTKMNGTTGRKLNWKNTSFVVQPTKTDIPAGSTPLNGKFGNQNTGSAGQQWYPYWAVGINPEDKTGVYLGYNSGTGATEEEHFTIAQTRIKDSKDPKIIPLPILKNDPQVMKTLLDVVRADPTVDPTDTTDWFIPVDSTRTVLPAANEDFAFRPYLKTAASRVNVAVYAFRVSLRDSTTPENVSGTKGNYFTKVIDDGGVNDGIILPHVWDSTDFNAVLSNKYVAMKVGTGVDETKIKVAVADSRDEAANALKALKHWNYIPQYVLKASTDIITILTSSAEWVQIPGQNPPVPVYDPDNTKNWIFETITTGTGADTITVHKVAVHNITTDTTSGGVTSISTNTGVYTVNMIKGDTSTGLFQLVGFGDDNLRFVKIKISDTTSTDTSAWIAVGDKGGTIADVEDKLDDQGTANFWQKSVITPTVDLGPMFDSLKSKGLMVEGKRAHPSDERFIDSKRRYEYQFSLTTEGNAQVLITTVTENNTKTDIYGLTPQPNPSGADENKEVYFKLVGSGLENNKLMGIYTKKTESLGRTFVIQVGGRTYTDSMTTPGGSHDDLIGDFIPNTVDDQTDNKVKLHHLNIKKTELEKDIAGLQTLQDVGTIAKMVLYTGEKSSGIYDKENTILYNFNVSGYTLQTTKIVDGVQSFDNYYVSVVKDYPGTDTIDNKVVLFLRDQTQDFITIPGVTGGGDFHNKLIVVEMIPNSDGKGFIILTDNISTTETLIKDTLKPRQTTLPFSYWSHESLANLIVDNSGQKDFESLLTTFRGATTDKYGTAPLYPGGANGWNVYGAIGTVETNGLVMLADNRFFKTDGGVTSRVKVSTSGNSMWGGYFDPNDTYLITKGSELNEIGVKRTSGNVNVRFRFKLVKKESDTASSYLVMRGVKSTGTPETLDLELDDAFLNKVVSIDLGSKKVNTDGVHIGFSDPLTDLTQTALNTVITAAILDREKKQGLIDSATTEEKLREYTPLLIPQTLSLIQHVVPFLIGGDTYRTFVGDGYTEKTGSGSSEIKVGNNILSARFIASTGTYNGPTDQSTIEVSLKPDNTINDMAQESPTTAQTTFLMKMLTMEADIFGGPKSTFTLHRPNNINTVFTTDPLWNNIIYSNVHVIQAGIGENFQRHKWAYASTKEEALRKLRRQPFYNGSLATASTENIGTHNNSTGNTLIADDRRNIVFDYLVIGDTFQENYIRDGSAKLEQNLTTLGFDMAGMNNVIFTFQGNYSDLSSSRWDERTVRVARRASEYPGATETTPVTYTLLLQNATANKGMALTFEGFGNLNGYTMFANVDSSSRVKMIFVKPKSGKHFNDIYNQFVLGIGTGYYQPSNFDVNLIK